MMSSILSFFYEQVRINYIYKVIVLTVNIHNVEKNYDFEYIFYSVQIITKNI